MTAHLVWRLRKDESGLVVFIFTWPIATIIIIIIITTIIIIMIIMIIVIIMIIMIIVIDHVICVIGAGLAASRLLGAERGRRAADTSTGQR